ncbi:LOW QUALITY PROTEIN: myosin-IIIb-like [Amphiura filiformis]|uniref:LOW QUALITY PROTEIN: myosin-IIIb-like n=1 Tax=Amphiura filiformis TaxID=82378 RepID=UPI003B212053
MASVEVGTTDDLASLSNLDEHTLLAELKHRYDHDKIYTYVGDILVAVNPFRDVGIYTKEFTEKYKNKKRVENPPHIFAVSDACYQAMLTGNAVGGKRNQCVVISGESGAGKTESTKLIIKQLIELCHGKSQLEQQILQVNPLLEAFGNAQTTMNDNSSRFGKYIQLKFKDGQVMGAKISEYLLEKSRVIHQNPGEENFHIFYYMMAGLSPEQQKKYHIGDPAKYKNLNNGPGCLKNNPAGVKKHFTSLTNAMDLVGFLDEEIDEMYKILSAVLSMGEIQFGANDDDSAVVQDSTQSIQTITELLGVEPEKVKNVLTFSSNYAKGSIIRRNYTKQQAQDARDAMTKALYGRLFSWIVNKINQQLAPEVTIAASEATEIGILDIFGFEHLQTNSFEQICINLANEQLQYFFNQHIFLLEQEEYKAEGIDWTYVPFVNNQSLLNLFMTKPIGIFALLDEESLFPQGSDHSYVEKLNRNFQSNHHYIKAKVSTSNNFSIDHYAGRVSYSADNFLEKNRDNLPNGVMQMLTASTNDLLGQIFRGTITRTGTLALQLRTNDNKKERKSVRKRGFGRQQTTRKLTQGAQFKNSLNVLLELLNLSNPHFVRCIKPNTTKAPKAFEDKYVNAQLRYTGMLETTRIRRMGYALRPKFSDFVNRYRLLARKKISENGKGCEEILKGCGLTQWHIGKTKLFLKYYHQDQLEEQLQKVGQCAVHIQKIVRGFLGRQEYKRCKEQARRQAAAMETFLAEIQDLSLTHHQQIEKLCEKDRRISQSFFGKIKENKEKVQFQAPAPPPAIIEDEPEPEEELEEEEVDSDDVIEDEFVKTVKKGGKFGALGTKAATIKWFKTTQSEKLRENTGVFSNWFHGIITRRQAEELLDSKPLGYYLIRVSESRFGYSLSLRAEQRCKHFMIDQLPNGKYNVVGEAQVFRTLNDLVYFYEKEPISPFGDVLKTPCGQETDECDYAELVEDDKDQAKIMATHSARRSRVMQQAPQINAPPKPQRGQNNNLAPPSPTSPTPQGSRSRSKSPHGKRNSGGRPIRPPPTRPGSYLSPDQNGNETSQAINSDGPPPLPAKTYMTMTPGPGGSTNNGPSNVPPPLPQRLPSNASYSYVMPDMEARPPPPLPPHPVGNGQ